MWILLVAAATFGICFLVDKGYTRIFRNRSQHKSGRSLRQNKRYGSMGFLLFVIGFCALITTNLENIALLIGSGILMLVGIGLVVYYMSSGIYYDDEDFIVESFGKRRTTYRYDQILHQQLYVLQGGGAIVELHMDNGKAVQVVSNRPGYDTFLHFAFRQWCRQKGLDPENCPFHDTACGVWFPMKEEDGCTFQA